MRIVGAIWVAVRTWRMRARRVLHARRPGESRDPVPFPQRRRWVPAFAGTTKWEGYGALWKGVATEHRRPQNQSLVVSAKAGTQFLSATKTLGPGLRRDDEVVGIARASHVDGNDRITITQPHHPSANTFRYCAAISAPKQQNTMRRGDASSAIHASASFTATGTALCNG